MSAKAKWFASSGRRAPASRRCSAASTRWFRSTAARSRSKGIGGSRAAAPTSEYRAAQGRSIVFQQYNLFPHKTALENMMMAPIHVLKRPRAEVEARAPN